ncbi:tRNA preQ1(34) S-adenosylmethionine ribosyltransferase-isomerase QueA [Patescibacteria group bacterium]
MRSDLFDYELPKELIAQEPLEPRDESRLFHLERGTNNFSHYIFKNIGQFLRDGDVLVLNNSKVIPARLRAVNEASHEFEILLLAQKGEDTWEALVKPGKKLKLGEDLIISKTGDDLLSAKMEEKLSGGTYLLRFNVKGADFRKKLEKYGEVPLPPYITNSKSRKDQYQTVFADPDKEGSAAAPTAGFHFTPELLASLEKQGVQIEYVTLHVGLGTFQPIRTDEIEEHQIHSEYFEIDPEIAEKIKQAKQEKRRVISVGTTAARVLETFGASGALEGETDIYIYPGYEWKIVDGLITNFHLPKTSLLALVASFVADSTDPDSGIEIIKQAYAEAIKQKYRFYSFGDAMLII